MKTQRLLLFLILLPLQLCAAVAPENLAVGDWVFRVGTGRESALIRHLDDGEYSHIGIVSPSRRKSASRTRLPTTTPPHPNQVINSSLAEFAAPRLAGKSPPPAPLS